MSSASHNQYVPDYAVPPGEILLETLEERGMTQAELAERTGRKKKTINEIIKGKAPITPETALQLERVFGVPASFWNNLEQQYRTDLARIAEQQRLASQIEWLDLFPVKELVRYGWVESSKDKIQLLQQVLNFFSVASPDRWHEVWAGEAVSYRKSPVFESNPHALAAWLRCGEVSAHAIRCAPYDKTVFRESLDRIRGLTKEEPEVFRPELARICAASGVAVVFIPELNRTRVSGATRWLTPAKAMIQLSLRHKSNDHLWFTFFHEAAHILMHGKKEVFVDDDQHRGDKEDEANKFAADFLIPPQAYKKFLQIHGTSISKNAISAFAEDIGIAPGIVVGRLQHEKILPPSHGNGLKVFYTWR